MEQDRVLIGIADILNDSNDSNKGKRYRLNQIEKEYPQQIFIKTHLCDCGKMSVEVWFKSGQWCLDEDKTDCN